MTRNYAVISTDLDIVRSGGTPRSIQTEDGIPVLFVNSSAGRLGEAITEGMVTRWNGRSTEHLTFADYGEAAAQTAAYPYAGFGNTPAVAYAALGLAGEAGEVANRVKRVIRDSDGHPTAEARRQIAEELGDVLWYLAALARELDIPLAGVAVSNLRKLVARKAKGAVNGLGEGLRTAQPHSPDQKAA